MPASISAPERELHTESPATSVAVHQLGDGLVVRLSGVLDGRAIPVLRRELLRPLPANCSDVLVDAGGVVALEDDALAVLLAGSSWAGDAGARFALSAVSPALATQIEVLDLADALPVLGSAG